MRHFIAYVEEEGGIYRRPRLRVKARLAPIRLHGRWVDDEIALNPPQWARERGLKPTLRRPGWTHQRAAHARKAVTHHGALWVREQMRRFDGRI